MTMHWAWFNYYGRSLIAWPLFGFGQPQTWVPFLYFGMALHIISWLTSLLPAHGFRPLEFLAVVVSGAIGGVILWLGAQQLFPRPVMQMELYNCLSIPFFMALFFWQSWSSRESPAAGAKIRIVNGGVVLLVGYSQLRSVGC